MLKKTVFLVLAGFTLMLSSCGKDDDGQTFTYPISAKFVSLVDKEPVEVYTNTGGVAVLTPLEDTELDEDPFFDGLTSSFDEILFTSSTQASLVGLGDLVLPDTLPILYTYANNEVKFAVDLSQFVGETFVIRVTAPGTPESFKIPSQAYIFDDTDGGFAVEQYTVETTEVLKENLLDSPEGSRFANLLYSQLFEK